ncbi:MAG TPA: hypothetical protein VKD24_08460 [Candidatus Angelobacter sp.]|nr:hypothetical protein [Candidatus Angelobacter sp.]
MNNEPQLDSVLKQMADDHQPELPSPSLIWWRAQLLRKQQDRARIERPIMVMRQVAMVVCLVLFAALGAANWQELQMRLAGTSWLLIPFIIALAMASLLSASALWPSAKP